MTKEKTLNKMKGITLIALIITIIILLILAGVVLHLAIGNNGVIDNASIATEETRKQSAIETINLKITDVQMKTYAEKQEMPTLQELANKFCEDNDFQYVTLSSKVASLEYIDVGNNSSIYTKLKNYPYEFEINSSLQLASIDGIKIANTSSTDSGYNMQIGINAIPAGNGWRRVYVEFDKEFLKTPNVFIQPMQNNVDVTSGYTPIGGCSQYEVDNVTSKGFYVRLYNESFTGKINFYWLAISK